MPDSIVSRSFPYWSETEVTKCSAKHRRKRWLLYCEGQWAPDLIGSIDGPSEARPNYSINSGEKKFLTLASAQEFLTQRAIRSRQRLVSVYLAEIRKLRGEVS